MDGLLLDTERMARDMFLVTAMAHGLVDEAEVLEVFLRCVGTRAATSNEIIAKAFGDRIDVDQFRKNWTAALMPLWASNIPTKQGAAAMFALVKAQGLPIAVATSTKTDLAEEHLKHAGLWEYVTLVVGGDQVSEGKPAPETYLTAAKRLGVDITCCVAFEDSDVGTPAAVRSGARTVQIPDLKQPSDATRALGHIIAPDLLTGARRAGVVG